MDKFAQWEMLKKKKKEVGLTVDEEAYFKEVGKQIKTWWYFK